MSPKTTGALFPKNPNTEDNYKAVVSAMKQLRKKVYKYEDIFTNLHHFFKDKRTISTNNFSDYIKQAKDKSSECKWLKTIALKDESNNKVPVCVFCIDGLLWIGRSHPEYFLNNETFEIKNLVPLFKLDGNISTSESTIKNYITQLMKGKFFSEIYLSKKNFFCKRFNVFSDSKEELFSLSIDEDADDLTCLDRKTKNKLFRYLCI